ncbi:hypothetical protein HYW67_02780 [Candidatus Parcubacteria bacterium]|nr:hypothetical protein [Candidatus Parcubacteria bacterium]
MQRKVLVLLLGGLALGLSASPRRHFRILRQMKEEWHRINHQALQRAIRRLYESKLVATTRNQDGSVTVELSDEGRSRALTYKLDAMRIPRPERWDGRWRLIAFDIPESCKKVREAFRHHLRQIGCLEFQKSVFVTPYPCDSEIDFLVELHRARSYVRKITAISIDNEFHLRQKFELLS